MLKKCFRGRAYAGVCILISSALSFLLLLPSIPVCLAITFLVTLLASAADTESGQAYLRDERHPPAERALAKNRVACVGDILAQMILFLGIFVMETARSDFNILPSYTITAPDIGIAAALRIICLVCCSVLAVMALLIFFLPRRRSRNIQA